MHICIPIVFILLLLAAAAAMGVFLSRRSAGHERPPMSYRDALLVDVEKGMLPFRCVCFAGANSDAASLPGSEAA